MKPSGPLPVLLRSENFTPASRTPWGGERILRRYKPGLSMPKGDVRVGESWEVSVEPDFPGLLDSGERLSEVIADSPRAWLGAAASTRENTALLVKLLDAALDLSVQIHPSDDYAGLAEDQSGKPESWYVLERSAGAGLYLGLRRGVDRSAMERALLAEEDVSALLYFVPVEPGDFFVIDAGTAHAIGAGTTLIEPQRVLPGKRGVTYRYWDWDRRYDAAGRAHPEGEPRALHVQAALDVTGWELPREEALLERIRHRAGPARLSGPARHELLGCPAGPAISPFLRVARLHGEGRLELPRVDALRGLTVIEGKVHIHHPNGALEVGAGRAAVLPAALPDLRVDLSSAHAILSSIT